MENICRACLTIEERDVNTLHQQFSEKDRNQFLYATGIQIKENEVSTFRLCKDCQENMNTSCKFKKNSRNSYKLFQTYLALKEGSNMDFITYIRNEESLYGFRFNNDPEYKHRNKDDDQMDNDHTIKNIPPEPDTILDDTIDMQWLQDDNAMSPDLPLSQLNTPRSQLNQSRSDFTNTPRHQTQNVDAAKTESQCVVDNNLLRAINNNKDICNIEDILCTPRVDYFLPKPMPFSDKEIEFSIGDNLNNPIKPKYTISEDCDNEELPNSKEISRKPRKSAPQKNMAKFKSYIENVNAHEINSSDDTIPETDEGKGDFKILEESKQIFGKPRKKIIARKDMDMLRRYTKDVNGHEINSSDDTIADTDDKLNTICTNNADKGDPKISEAEENVLPHEDCPMRTEIYQHISRDNFKCMQCDFTVHSKKLFVQHCSNEHNIDVVVKVKYARSMVSCETCGKIVARTNMGYHMKSHEVDEKETEESTLCKICKLKFQNKNKLKAHMSTHKIKVSNNVEQIKDSKIYKYACSKCPYRTKSTSNLNVHLRRHEKKFTYICNECGKGHIRKGDLERHYRVHSGAKPFKCPHCPSSFCRLDHLNLHIRDHTGERPYVCYICEEAFKQCGDLTYHKRYVCPG